MIFCYTIWVCIVFPSVSHFSLVVYHSRWWLRPCLSMKTHLTMLTKLTRWVICIWQTTFIECYVLDSKQGQLNQKVSESCSTRFTNWLKMLIIEVELIHQLMNTGICFLGFSFFFTFFVCLFWFCTVGHVGS